MTPSNNMKTFQAVVERWESVFGQRKSQCDMKEFFEMLSISTDDNFKRNLFDLYERFSGMEDGEYDDKLVSFWNFRKSNARAKEDFFTSQLLWPFADYAFDLNVFCVDYHLGQNNSVYLVTEGEAYKISENLETFFEMMMQAPEQLLIFTST